MSEKITWTHVDRYVREAVTRAGIIYLGSTDAEVALSYISYLERSLEVQGRNGDRTVEELRRTRDELADMKAKCQSVSKTKKRLAALEAKVEELVAWTGLER